MIYNIMFWIFLGASALILCGYSVQERKQREENRGRIIREVVPAEEEGGGEA